MEEYRLTNLHETNQRVPTNSPNNKIRYFTDIPFIYFFAFILSTWLGFVIYVFISGKGWQFLKETGDNIKEVERNSLNYPIIELLSAIAREPFNGHYHRKSSPLFIISGLYAAFAFMLNCFIIARYYPRLITWIGIFCLFAVIIKSICEINLDRSLTINLETFPFPSYNAVDSISMRITVYATKICFCILGLICLKKAGITTIVDILTKVINALFFFAHLIIFGLFILTLEIFIVFLTIVSFYSLSMSTAVLYLILFQGIYLVTFIYYYGKIIVTPTIACWYLSGSKSSISNVLLFENIARVTRHHFGTVSLASIPFLPFCMASFVAFEHRFNKNRSIFNRISDSILLVYLTWNTIDYSLIVTSMYGTNFYESTKKAFRLLTKNSSLSLASAYVFYALIMTGTYLSAFAGSIPALIWSHEKPYVPIAYALVLVLPAFLLLDLLVQVCLLCSLADDEEEEDNTEENTASTNITM